MINIIATRLRVTARKDHKCSFCGGIIRKGDKYNSQTLKYDKIYTWKSHLRCDELVDVLDMEGDEGITSDDFMEYINQKYYELIGDKSVIHNFQERLDTVYKHYS